MTYKIKKYSKLRVANQDVYTIHRFENNCPDITIGDEIDIEGEILIINKMERFKKSFDIEGDNVVVGVEPLEE